MRISIVPEPVKRSSQRAFGLSLAIMLVVAPHARAATWYVSNSGTDFPGCGTKDNPCRSISRAINAAIAAAPPETRLALVDRLYGLDAGTMTRQLSARTGLADRMRIRRALRG